VYGKTGIERQIMRKRLLAATGLVVLVLGLVGCFESGTYPTPTWDPPTPTPTSGWTEEEQAALDAVERYHQVDLELSLKLPHLTTEDFDRIVEVTADPLRKEMFEDYFYYQQERWTIVGTPVFTPESVQKGMLDNQGWRYHVSGCYVQEEVIVYDASGVVLEPVWYRSYRTYTAFPRPDGTFVISEFTNKENGC
jgi:hypothetical protein